MKLAGAEARRYFAKPDPQRPAVLIYGADPMRVALRRQELIAALIGPDGPSEMRLTRMAAAELRKDGARLGDEMRAQGFFPGQRAVLLEEAGDGVTAQVAAVLADWRDGDAVLVVTAGALAAKSSLRKFFETDRAALAIGLYDDPPDRDEITALLKAAGVGAVAPEAAGDIAALARALDPGDFRQMVEKLGLYKFGDGSALSSAEIAALAPATIEAELDDILHVVAEGRAGEIGPLMQRLGGQGVAAVGLCIAANRHFRTLHAACVDGGGVAQGLARARPPVFGPRRERMAKQAQAWGMARLETALAMVVDTDLTLRSAQQRAPALALVERLFIRLAMMVWR